MNMNRIQEEKREKEGEKRKEKTPEKKEEKKCSSNPIPRPTKSRSLVSLTKERFCICGGLPL